MSVEKLLGIVIRYYSTQKNDFVTTFLTLIDVNGGKAEDLLLGLGRALKLYGLDIQKLVAVGTDNAANMTGVNNGLHKLLKNKYGLKNLVLVRCVCHSLQLAVSAATDNSFLPNAHYMIKETYNWFSNSSIRQKIFKRIYKLINSDCDNPVKIPKAAPTRWLSVEKTIKKMLSMWLELRTHFTIVNDKHLETSLLKEMYNDGKNYVYLTYLASVLKEVQEVNLAFESRNADHVKLFDDLLRLLKSLTNRIIIPCVDFDYIGGDLDPAINNFVNFGYSFEKSCSDYEISPRGKK